MCWQIGVKHFKQLTIRGTKPQSPIFVGSSIIVCIGWSVEADMRSILETSGWTQDH